MPSGIPTKYNGPHAGTRESQQATNDHMYEVRRSMQIDPYNKIMLKGTMGINVPIRSVGFARSP